MKTREKIALSAKGHIPSGLGIAGRQVLSDLVTGPVEFVITPESCQTFPLYIEAGFGELVQLGLADDFSRQTEYDGHSKCFSYDAQLTEAGIDLLVQNRVITILK